MSTNQCYKVRVLRNGSHAGQCQPSIVLRSGFYEMDATLANVNQAVFNNLGFNYY